MLFFLFVFVPLWVLAARWTVRHIWKTAEPAKRKWEDSANGPYNYRWLLDERWDARGLTIFCLVLWPLALVANFLTSKVDRPSPWERFVRWMMPKGTSDE